MRPPPSAWKRRATRLLSEPIAYFFVIGALLFVAHRLVVGNPRVVVVTPGVTADVARRFGDGHGRPPSPSELDDELRRWEQEEALYREALRDGLDRNDATIRTVLADRVRARASQAIIRREPSSADLESWLATHRSLYEAPRRYDYGSVAFPKSDKLNGSASAEREKYGRALARGADPRTLGRSVVGGDLTADDLKARLGPTLAAQIQSLPVGQWRSLESDGALLLVRLNAVGGGLPSAAELHARLVADWMFDQHKRAGEQAVQAIVDGYRFEVRR